MSLGSKLVQAICIWFIHCFWIFLSPRTVIRVLSHITLSSCGELVFVFMLLNLKCQFDLMTVLKWKIIFDIVWATNAAFNNYF